MATFITQSFVAIPEYWLAPMVILIFAIYLQVLPSAGWTGPSSIILPAFVLSLRPMAYFTRVTRAAMIEGPDRIAIELVELKQSSARANPET